MIISHNISAMNTQRQLNIMFRNRGKTMEKLSSGYQINRAADNAAGLAISEKMRRQIRGLTQASKNVQDGISFCQVADGALDEMHTLLQRMNELAVKSANGTNQEEDRLYIDEEVQQLKHELNRTAGTTSFNENKIFRSLYTPDVSGRPDDYQLFNANSIDMGGVRVNDVRYTWAELGIDSTKVYGEGGKSYFTEDLTIKKTLANGETLELQGTKDQELSTISRVYRWKAENDGIVINDNTAEKITWANVMHVQSASPMNTGRVEAGTYAFQYHGMTIEFDVPEGDTQIADIEMGIDGGDAISVAHWFTIPVGVDESKGVNIDEQTSKAGKEITTSNHNLVASTNFMIYADDEGIRLTSAGISDADSKTDTQILWKNIVVTPADSQHKINDWGAAGETSDAITLAAGTRYTYKNDITGVEFDFTLQDEVSLEEVKKGLTIKVNRAFDTDMADDAKQSLASGGIEMGVTNAKMSFGMQNLLLGGSLHMAQGNLGDWTAKVKATLNSDEDYIDLEYKYTGNNGAEAVYTGGISKQMLIDSIKSNASSVSIASIVNLENKDSLLAGIPDAEKGQQIKNIADSDKSIQVDFNITNLAQKYKTEVAALLPAENTQEKRDEILDNIYKEALTQIVGGTAADASKQHNFTLATSKATYVGFYDENANVNRHTRFGTQVIAAKRDLMIQAGTEADHKIVMEWRPISLSILGIGELAVDKESTAERAIDLLKDAHKYISTERSTFGAYQNRLEHAQKNLDNIVENTTSAESAIRDTEMAAGSLRLALQNILIQAGQAMLAQANQIRENVVELLRR